MTDTEYEIKLEKELFKRDLLDFSERKKAFETKEKELEARKVKELEAHEKKAKELETREAEMREREVQVKVLEKHVAEQIGKLQSVEEEVSRRRDEVFVKEAEITVRENIVREKEEANV